MTPKIYDGNDLCLMASDVEALLPSLDPKNSSRIVKEVVVDSNVKFDGVDLRKALLYIFINQDSVEQKDLEKLKDFLPERKKED